METRKYQCETMFEALQRIQAELGPDAIVLSAREIPMGPVWNVWRKKGVEVVAAPPLQNNAPQTAQTKTVLRRSADGAHIEFEEAAPAIEWVGGQPAFPPGEKTPSHQPQRWSPPHLSRAEIRAAQKQAAHPVAVSAETVREQPAARPETEAAGTAEQPLPPSLQRIQQRLLEQGVEADFVRRTLHRLNQTLGAAMLKDDELCLRYVQEVLAAELRLPAPGALRLPGRWVCLVGASGSGKTSTTAKLAMLYSQHLGKKVVWVCADTIRTGAIAEARAYTDALNIPLRLVYRPEDVQLIADEMQDADVFLVDTAGFNPCREDPLVELGELLSQIPQRVTWLVASALTRESDLIQISAALGVFRLNGMVFTRMDETMSFGSVYNFARRTPYPLRYFAYGKETAGKFQAAEASRLSAALFGKGWSKD
jgi:flagellar biosynthesis protein FlhF